MFERAAIHDDEVDDVILSRRDVLRSAGLTGVALGPEALTGFARLTVDADEFAQTDPGASNPAGVQYFNPTTETLVAYENGQQVTGPLPPGEGTDIGLVEAGTRTVAFAPEGGSPGAGQTVTLTANDLFTCTPADGGVTLYPDPRFDASLDYAPIQAVNRTDSATTIAVSPECSPGKRGQVFDLDAGETSPWLSIGDGSAGTLPLYMVADWPPAPSSEPATTALFNYFPLGHPFRVFRGGPADDPLLFVQRITTSVDTLSVANLTSDERSFWVVGDGQFRLVDTIDPGTFLDFTPIPGLYNVGFGAADADESEETYSTVLQPFAQYILADFGASSIGAKLYDVTTTDVPDDMAALTLINESRFRVEALDGDGTTIRQAPPRPPEGVEGAFSPVCPGSEDGDDTTVPVLPGTTRRGGTDKKAPGRVDTATTTFFDRLRLDRRGNVVVRSRTGDRPADVARISRRARTYALIANSRESSEPPLVAVGEAPPPPIWHESESWRDRVIQPEPTPGGDPVD